MKSELDDLHRLQEQIKTAATEDIVSGEIVSRYIDFVTIISKIASRLIKAQDFDSAINDSLADLGKVTGASRAYLFFFREECSKMDNTHEWCADGVEPQKENLQDLPTTMFPWWMKKLRNNEMIQIVDVARMPQEAKAEKEILEQQDVKSLLVIPVFIKDQLIGFIGFDNVKGKGRWPDSTILLLRLITENIGSTIERMQIEQTLRIKEHAIESSVDAIAITDLEGSLTYVNNSFLKLWGYDDEKEVLGKPAIIFWQSVDTFNEIADTLRRKGNWIGELIALRKDGTTFDVQFSASTVRDDSGKPICMMGSCVDITHRKRAEEELRKLATYDALTDVYNRRSGLLLFKQQFQLAKRNNQKLCVCYVDVDFLKNINDVYGHAEGDEVLKATSAILKQTLRTIDIVCRLGGDEFLLVLPQCTLKQASDIWQRIEENVELHNDKRTKPYSISLSRGFAEFDPENEKSPDFLIMVADKEMYIHKRTKYRE